jgi:outer membrane protein OmpA-like peptidoglycan-associated protein
MQAKLMAINEIMIFADKIYISKMECNVALMKKKVQQCSNAGILFVFLVTLIIAGFPSSSIGSDNGITVFWIESDPVVKDNYYSEPVKDFYINGGEDDGLSESMVLDVYREKYIPDPNTGKEFKVNILVGQVEIISLFKNIAITRIIALTSSYDAPIIRYRTVMLGDFVVPKGTRISSDTSARNKPVRESDARPVSLPPAVMFPSEVLFEFGNSELKPEAMEALAIVQRMFNESKNKDILIEGHTCSLGSDEYNLELSRKRTQSVADYLVNKLGIPGDRVRTLHYGEKFPIASNATEEGRAKNRRVSIRLLPQKAKIVKK